MKRQRHWTYHEEKLLPSILRRDNYECQIRGPQCRGVADSVDHIHPKALGGRGTADNLRAACKPCNMSKGARWAAPQRGPFLRNTRPLESPLQKISLRTSRWATEPVEMTTKGTDS